MIILETDIVKDYHYNTKIKQCTKCQKFKIQSSFYKNKNTKIVADICVTCTNSPGTIYKVCKQCDERKAAVEYSYLNKHKQGRHDVCRECKATKGNVYRICKSCNETKSLTVHFGANGEFEVCKVCRPKWFADYIAWAQKTATHQNCNGCKVDKPFEDFPPSKRRKYFPYDSVCRVCVKEKYPSYLRHNISIEQYQAQLEAQNYCCYNCGRHEDEVRTSKGGLAVDHDHKCECKSKDGKSCGKCIRKLICAGCNNGLGCFQDNISVMFNAISYVDEHDIEPQTIDITPEVKNRILKLLS